MSVFWAILVLIFGDMVKKELRNRVKFIPYGVLRLGSIRLPVDIRQSRLDEWRTELEAILLEQQGRPLSRLVVGLRYSFGIAWSAGSIRCELEAVAPRLIRLLRTLACLICMALLGPVAIGIKETADLSRETVGMTAVPILLVGLALIARDVRDARVIVWLAVNVILWSVTIDFTSIGTPDLVLMATGTVTLAGAVIGRLRPEARRLAAVGLMALPTLLTLLFGWTFYRSGFDADGSHLASAALLLLFASVTARYARISLGRTTWREGRSFAAAFSN